MKNKIRELAIKKHKEANKLYDGMGYHVHLDKVHSVGQELFGNSIIWANLEDLLYLHDTKEDTEITDEEILSVTNPMVLQWVNLLTDKEGNNREERHLNTYCLLRESQEAVCGKLCDRIANIRYSIETKNISKMSMYLKEGKYFKFALYDKRHTLAKKGWDVYNKEIKNLIKNIKKKNN